MSGKHVFKDLRGRTWVVDMSLAAAHRIDACDFSQLVDREFSILRPDKELFVTILTNTGLTFAVIWAIVQPQVKAQMKMDPVEDQEAAQMEFQEGVDGTVIQEGRRALWGALADFFPERQTALSSLGRQIEAANKTATEELTAMEPEIQEVMQAQVRARTRELREELRRELEKSRGETSGE